MEEYRLNKFLAMSGVCSRRDADKLIEAGRVKVNDAIAVSGQKVTDNDTVTVDNVAVKRKLEKVVIAYDKPRGVVVTERDEHATTTIMDVIDYPERLTYAGRLDKESEGLLLLTNDGDFINAAMRGAHDHDKEYIVEIDRDITNQEMNKLRNGIFLEELNVKTKPCTIEKIKDCSYRVIISQGLNRQIRRMFQACGRQVKSLKRIRVITVELGNLEPGEYRELSREEQRALYDRVGLTIN